MEIFSSGYQKKEQLCCTTNAQSYSNRKIKFDLTELCTLAFLSNEVKFLCDTKLFFRNRLDIPVCSLLHYCFSSPIHEDAKLKLEIKIFRILSPLEDCFITFIKRYLNILTTDSLYPNSCY